MTFDEAMEILAAFEREHVEYVLVGSMAMAVHGILRATRDIDFFVSPTPENVSRLRTALDSIYRDPNLGEITSDDLAGDYPAVEYTPPHGRYSMDILARLGEMFRYADLESQDVDVNGTRVRVATPRMLVRMKKGTIRPLDHADAARIREVFEIDDD